MLIHPFSAGDARPSFQNMIAKTIQEIEALDNNYVLNSSATELEQFYVSQITITPLELDAQNHYIESQESTQVDISRDTNRAYFGRGSKFIKGTLIKIAIPFTGHPDLWRFRPSHAVSGSPELEIREDVVVFTAKFADDAPETERLKNDIERSIQSLSRNVAHLKNDVIDHNTEGPKAVRAALQQKLAKSKIATGAVSALGIRFKPKDKPETYVAPIKRRPSPVARPAAQAAQFTPEPTLEEAEFEHILKVLRGMSLVIERSPSNFANLDEEGIRLHFLIQLNGHYEGAATGETFNASGKTDILIRSGDRNIFIAECKFWRGQQSFSGALDQLLTYLSWRDSKCALLIFNQTKDSSAVRAKMHEIMIARPDFRKTVSHDPNGDSRYVFVKASDPGKEIQIQTMLFDVPKP